jgi:hypothetical protein
LGEIGVLEDHGILLVSVYLAILQKKEKKKKTIPEREVNVVFKQLFQTALVLLFRFPNFSFSFKQYSKNTLILPFNI